MDTAELAGLIEQLTSPEERARREAAVSLYREGADRAQSAIRHWATDKELARLISGPPTVGVAVHAERFELLRRVWSREDQPLPLATVPAEQDAREFELHIEFDGADARLDILAPRGPSDPASRGEQGAIARFLARQGEGIQQVEFPCKDVARAGALLRERHSVEPVYPEPRPGAGGTCVNFFLVPVPSAGKILIELYGPAQRSPG